MKTLLILTALLIALSPLMGEETTTVTKTSSSKSSTTSSGFINMKHLKKEVPAQKKNDMDIEAETESAGEAQMMYNLSGNQQTKTLLCDQSDVQIHGNNNRITTTGDCASIFVTGNNNRVTWSGEKPRIVDHGTGNTVKKK